MAIFQLSDGRWKVDVEPVKGKRFRKVLKTKAEAQRFEATCRSKCIDTPNWAPKPKDRRRLSELVTLWFDLHGVSLSDGVRRHAILKATAKAMGDPLARSVEGSHVAAVRARWISNSITGKTANNRLGYLKAVYNELHKLDVINYPCPFTRIRPIRLQERPLAYLAKPQIAELLEALRARQTAPHTAMVACICLATGARWGEAQALRPNSIKGNSLVFSNTKSKRVRVVPVSPSLIDAIREHWNQHGPFSNCIGVFRKICRSTRLAANPAIFLGTRSPRTSSWAVGISSR